MDAVHKVAYDLESLKLVLELIPEAQRHQAFMAKDFLTRTVLDLVKHRSDFLDMLHQLVPMIQEKKQSFVFSLGSSSSSQGFFPVFFRNESSALTDDDFFKTNDAGFDS